MIVKTLVFGKAKFKTTLSRIRLGVAGNCDGSFHEFVLLTNMLPGFFKYFEFFYNVLPAFTNSSHICYNLIVEVFENESQDFNWKAVIN